MKKLWLGLFALGFLISVQGHAETTNLNVIKPFKASYRLFREQLEIGQVKINLRRLADGGFHYQSVSTVSGFARLFRNDKITESSFFEIIDNNIKVHRYRYIYENSDKDRDVSIDFDWHKNRVKTIAKGHAWKMHIEPGTLDKFVIQLALVLDIYQGNLEPIYNVADGGKLKQYTFVDIGTEQLSTVLGKLNTRKYLRGKLGKKNQSIIWLAPDYDYQFVQVEKLERGVRYYLRLDTLKKQTISD